MAKAGFKMDMSKLEKALDSMESKFDVAMRMKCEQYAQQLQTDAQVNAKWQNRTGEARRRLNGSYEPVVNGYKLVLAHGVDYGIWLELAHEKRYAIIMQVIEYTGTFAIMPDFEDFMRRICGNGSK